MLLSVIAMLGAQAAQDRFGWRVLVSKQADASRSSSTAEADGRGVRMLRFPYALAICIGTFASLWLFGHPAAISESVFASWTQ